MYSIRWPDSKGVQAVVVGDLKSILALASCFEATKTKFKVADVTGFCVKQSNFGVGGFQYWVDPEQSLKGN